MEQPNSSRFTVWLAAVVVSTGPNGRKRNFRESRTALTDAPIGSGKTNPTPTSKIDRRLNTARVIIIHLCAGLGCGQMSRSAP
jgi:hypothetical protein